MAADYGYGNIIENIVGSKKTKKAKKTKIDEVIEGKNSTKLYKYYFVDAFSDSGVIYFESKNNVTLTTDQRTYIDSGLSNDEKEKRFKNIMQEYTKAEEKAINESNSTSSINGQVVDSVSQTLPEANEEILSELPEYYDLIKKSVEWQDKKEEKKEAKSDRENNSAVSANVKIVGSIKELIELESKLQKEKEETKTEETKTEETKTEETKTITPTGQSENGAGDKQYSEVSEEILSELPEYYNLIEKSIEWQNKKEEKKEAEDNSTSSVNGQIVDSIKEFKKLESKLQEEEKTETVAEDNSTSSINGKVVDSVSQILPEANEEILSELPEYYDLIKKSVEWQNKKEEKKVEAEEKKVDESNSTVSINGKVVDSDSQEDKKAREETFNLILSAYKHLTEKSVEKVKEEKIKKEKKDAEIEAKETEELEQSREQIDLMFEKVKEEKIKKEKQDTEIEAKETEELEQAREELEQAREELQKIGSSSSSEKAINGSNSTSQVNGQIVGSNNGFGEPDSKLQRQTEEKQTITPTGQSEGGTGDKQYSEGKNSSGVDVNNTKYVEIVDDNGEVKKINIDYEIDKDDSDTKAALETLNNDGTLTFEDRKSIVLSDKNNLESIDKLNTAIYSLKKTKNEELIEKIKNKRKQELNELHEKIDKARKTKAAEIDTKAKTQSIYTIIDSEKNMDDSQKIWEVNHAHIGTIYVTPPFSSMEDAYWSRTERSDGVAFTIPLQTNLEGYEISRTATYNSLNFFGQIGEIQQYANTKSLQAINVTTKYYVDCRDDQYGSDNKNGYDLADLQDIELKYKSLVLPAETKGRYITDSKDSSKNSFTYFTRPPIINIVLGSSTILGSNKDDTTVPNKEPYKNLFTDIYCENNTTKIKYKNYVVTDVSIKKNTDDYNYYATSATIKKNGDVTKDFDYLDLMGFEVTLTILEIDPNYLNSVPTFNTYYNVLYNRNSLQ